MKKVNNISNLSAEQRIISSLPPTPTKKNSRASFNTEAVYQYNIQKKVTTPLFNKNYGDVLYGKLDYNNDVVLPIGQNLKQIQIVENGPFCLSFVTDAYEDFFTVWSKYIQEGRVLDTPDFKAVALSGHLNFETVYEEQLDLHYDLFLNYIFQAGLRDKITDFDEFLRYFSIYLSSSSFSNPLNASSFVRSKNCSPLVSGMLISLSNQPLNDETKNNWINHPNFQLLNETANLYGFIVDKNIPWHLYYNLRSPASAIYLERYTTRNSVFKDLFIKVDDYDFYFLQKATYDLYTRFTERYPQYKETFYKVCSDSTRSKTIFSERERFDQTTIKQILSSPPTEKWIRFYCFVRCCEQKLPWDQKKFDSLSQDVYSLSSELDKEQAIRYLNKTLSDAKIEPSTNIRFLF